MASLLEGLNLYPESRFWRVRGEPSVSNVAGGLATILLIIGMVAYSISQLVIVFEKSSVKINNLSTSPTTNQVIYAQSPSPSTHQSVMIAFRKIDGFQPTVQSNNQTNYLQNCTLDHFQGMSNEFFDENMMPICNIFTGQGCDQTNHSDFYCLPLKFKHSFGEVNQNSVYSGKGNPFTVTFYCLNTGLTTQCTGNTFPLQTVHWFSKMSSSSQDGVTWRRQYNKVLSDMQMNSLKTYRNFIKKVEEKDYSDIVFGGSYEQSEGYSVSEQSQLASQDYHYSGRASLMNYQFQFYLDDQMQILELHYYTVLQVLTEIGGLFNVFFAFFIIFGWYSRSFSELVIAGKYFGSKVAGSYSFFGYLQLRLYQILAKMGCIREWPQARVRDKLSGTVSSLMDVVYLHRRIQFLEKAISVVLEEYQIRGIYLYQSLKRRQVDENYERHSFRRKYKKNIVKRKGKENDENNEGDLTAKVMEDKKQFYEDANNIREDLVVNKGTSLDEESSDGQQFTDEALEDANLQDLEREMEGSLRKLLETSRSGDERSRKIVDRMDPDMLQTLGRSPSQLDSNPLKIKKSKPLTLQLQEFQPQKKD